MNETAESRRSALACLKEICKLHPGADFDAALAGCDQARPSSELLLELGGKLRLFPESVSDLDLPELRRRMGSFLLIQFEDGLWAGYLGIHPPKEGVSEERVAVFDPLSSGSSPVKDIPLTQFVSLWKGRAVIFHAAEAEVYSIDGRHTAIYSLAAVGRKHGLDLSARRLLHDYAIAEAEVSERMLLKIVDDAGMKGKFADISWDHALALGEAFPALAFKRDGRCVVLCGAGGQAGAGELAVWDPSKPPRDVNGLLHLKRDAYEGEFSGRVLLLKRRYSLLDESQPFGLSWFIPEFMRMRTVFQEIALAVFAISAIALATPLFFQIVVDKVLVHQTYSTLNVLAVGIAVALLFNAALEYLRGYLLLYATNHIDIRTAVRTFQHLLDLPLSFFESIPAGVLLKHMQQTDKIRGFLSGNLFFTVLELVSLAVFLPVMLLYSVKLTLVAIAFAVAIALIVVALINPFQRRLQELYLAEGKRQSMLVETVNGIKTVKSLALEATQRRRWNDTAAFAITRYFRVGQISLTAQTFSGLLEKLMYVAVIWIGALAVFDHQMTVGALIAFQMLSNRVSSPLIRIVGLIHEYQQTALSVRMLGQVMNAAPEPATGGIQRPLKGRISFENVSFQYAPELPPALKAVSLELPAGSTLGVVGRSGSGKSTLLKLLQGLYPLQGGIIKIDGIDIREICRTHLRSSLGVVLQENFFFHGSVRENIAITKRDATPEEVAYAAKMAGAENFIQKLPKGFDSILEENATNLSGGQRQRLAIARALLTNPRILIFDEATSALDPESEEEIRRNLKLICRDRTVIIVSHRLSMITGADRIVVIDGGEIAESGRHDELLAANGIYHEFWRRQMEGGVEL